jgi:hypothetical protein
MRALGLMTNSHRGIDVNSEESCELESRESGGAEVSSINVRLLQFRRTPHDLSRKPITGLKCGTSTSRFEALWNPPHLHP